MLIIARAGLWVNIGVARARLASLEVVVKKVFGRLLLLAHHQLHHIILIHEFLAEANSFHILKHALVCIEGRLAQLVIVY